MAPCVRANKFAKLVYAGDVLPWEFLLSDEALFFQLEWQLNMLIDLDISSQIPLVEP